MRALHAVLMTELENGGDNPKFHKLDHRSFEAAYNLFRMSTYQFTKNKRSFQRSQKRAPSGGGSKNRVSALKADSRTPDSVSGGRRFGAAAFAAERI
jgi:hypothetical protein